jgi:hypothetical protein
MKASSSWRFPRACYSLAGRRKMRSSIPLRTHCWERRWQVCQDEFLGRFTPLRAYPHDPKNSIAHGPRILPWPTTTVATLLRTKDWFDHFPLGIREFPIGLSCSTSACFPMSGE